MQKLAILTILILSFYVPTGIALTPNSQVSTMANQVNVSDAWARATFALAKTGAAYLTIENQSNSDITLLSASVDKSIASVVQIHHTVMENDMMAMQELSAGLVIPKASSVSLSPGGVHIMLMGLQGPLKEKESFELRLYFADKSSHITQVLVKDLRKKAKQAHSKMNQQMEMNHD